MAIVIEIVQKAIGDAIDKLPAKLEAMDRSGRQAMIGMRSLGEATQLAGLNSGLSQTIMLSANAADTVGDLAGAIIGMANPATIAVTGLGLAFALMSSKAPELNKLNEELKNMASAEASAQGLATLAGVTVDQAQKALDAAKSNRDFAAELKNLADKAQGVKDPLGEVSAQLDVIRNAMNDAAKSDFAVKIMALNNALLMIQSGHPEKALDVYNATIAKSTQEVAEQTKAQADLKEKVESGTDVLARRTTVEQHYSRAARQNAAFAALEAENTKNLTSAMEKLVSAQKNILSGAIDKAMAPTSVTDLDMQMTALGKYQDKWDEFARRADAIANGTDMGAFGADFAAQFAGLGMSADDAARKFRNFSLFAGGQNMDLLAGSWASITDNVAEQLDAMIGQAEVKEKAFKEVYDRLPEDKKKALQKLGIGQLSDMDKTTLKVAKAADFNEVLNQAKSDILSSVPKEMSTTIYVTYKTAGGAAFTGDNGGTGGGGANISGGGGGGDIAMANGGSGVTPRSTTFRSDPGEAFWFSGKDHDVPPPGGVNISMGNVSIRNDSDITRLAKEIASEIQRNQRR